MMICTLAPVAFSKSGALRCSGSAICGPVNVSTRTVTPLNFWLEFVEFEPFAQAAINPTPTNRTRALARCRLMSIFFPYESGSDVGSGGAAGPLNMGCLAGSSQFVKLGAA